MRPDDERASHSGRTTEQQRGRQGEVRKGGREVARRRTEGSRPTRPLRTQQPRPTNDAKRRRRRRKGGRADDDKADGSSSSEA
mmetsp:Transcript_23158/g.71176  ORF Transcript_23158/g.71176 Transcript_23158/m.71176 type:complete len:83 (+) Transcript_23158:36-284(+)